MQHIRVPEPPTLRLRDLANMLVRFSGDRCGASAAEYALILGFIALAIVGSLIALGEALQRPLNAVANAL